MFGFDFVFAVDVGCWCLFWLFCLCYFVVWVFCACCLIWFMLRNWLLCCEFRLCSFVVRRLWWLLCLDFGVASVRIVVWALRLACLLIGLFWLPFGVIVCLGWCICWLWWLIWLVAFGVGCLRLVVGVFELVVWWVALDLHFVVWRLLCFGWCCFAICGCWAGLLCLVSWLVLGLFWVGHGVCLFYLLSSNVVTW